MLFFFRSNCRKVSRLDFPGIFSCILPMWKIIKRFSSSQAKLCELNGSLASKLKLIECEYELLKHQEPNQVPQHLSVDDYDYLLQLEKCKPYGRNSWVDVSSWERKRVLHKIAQLEQFDGNNICEPFTGREIARQSRRKVVTALPFMQKLVIDLSFEKHMCNLEIKNLIEQLMRIVNMNKSSSNPSDLFCIHLTGLHDCVNTSKFLDLLFPQAQRAFYPNVMIHNEPFAEIFQPSQLVFLSPHSDQVLQRFEADKIYIIGGVVDRREILSLSMPKASQLGLATARLPDHLVRKKLIQSLDSVFKCLRLLKSDRALS